MRTINGIATLCLASALMAGAAASAASAPIMAPSAVAGPDIGRSAAMPVRFHGRRAGWHGWRSAGLVGPYVWDDSDDDACSGDHPRWMSAYAGYPSFWCSPGFGAYRRHWPQH